jgi:peptidoglycan/LPS O-acetylase OafA/YrhL
MIGSAPKPIARLSSISYEYYLVHGIALAGAIKMLPVLPLLAIAVGILGALCLAALLNAVVAWTNQRLVAEIHRATPGEGGHA